MIQETLFQTTPSDKFDLLTKDELIYLYKEEERLRIKYQNENGRLKSEIGNKEQITLKLEEEYILLREKLFGKSSEKGKKKKSDSANSGKKPKKRVRLPSERYPNIPIKDIDLNPKTPPECDSCGEEMKKTGLQEITEKLTVIPKKYEIERHIRDKYGCKCCESLKTPPMPPQIVPGGSFSNELILDISLSKFCDLIPIERYCEMAARQGLVGLSQNSVIEQTHHYSGFLRGVYDKMGREVFHQGEPQVKADESPYKMLEGDKKSSWYLWGFSTDKSCFFDARGTRSGDVAWEHLVYSDCRYLLTDVYSGYKKAIRLANKKREELGLPKIIGVYCNVHCRRNFINAHKAFKKQFEKELLADPEFIENDPAQFFIKKYERIYKLEKYVKKVRESYPEDLINKECYEKCLRLRGMMKKYFDQMRDQVPEVKYSNSSKSAIGKAVRYLDKNFEGLTFCLSYPEIDLDNNSQESLFRSPAVGKKTWYGTHSPRGAETTSIIFTVVEGAKKNGLNPREYCQFLNEHLLKGGDPVTPYEYSQMIKNKN